MPNFGEIYVTFSIDPFVINGLEDVKWQVNELTLDMSETLSPTALPPTGYVTPFAGPTGFKPMWKGFFAGAIMVTLPNKFSKDNQPVTAGVHNLIIDDMGVSCIVSASNILPISSGNASGWAFSINQFNLTVIKNQVTSAGFDGLVHVPIFRGQTNTTNHLANADCMPYHALIMPGDSYQFTILQQPNAKFAVDMWNSGEVILSNCSVDLKYANGEFTNKATLNCSY
jgi:hypothetical protein